MVADASFVLRLVVMSQTHRFPAPFLPIFFNSVKIEHVEPVILLFGYWLQLNLLLATPLTKLFSCVELMIHLEIPRACDNVSWSSYTYSICSTETRYCILVGETLQPLG